MTQQNAAMVEETTAATAQLRRQANVLAESVAKFELGQDVDHAQERRSRAAAA
jgi:methyl-accepting chemotaxis protein